MRWLTIHYSQRGKYSSYSNTATFLFFLPSFASGTLIPHGSVRCNGYIISTVPRDQNKQQYSYDDADKLCSDKGLSLPDGIETNPDFTASCIFPLVHLDMKPDTRYYIWSRHAHFNYVIDTKINKLTYTSDIPSAQYLYVSACAEGEFI